MNRRGFTLLEVVVALAILGLSLLAIFDLNAGAVNGHAYAKRLTVATMLARAKMTDLEQDLYDKGFDADDQERSGDFKAEGWDGFTWKAQILAPRTANVSPDKLIEALFGIPAGPGGGVAGLASLFGGGRDGGVGGAASSLSSLASSVPGLSSGALPPGATQAGGLQALGPLGTLAETQMTQLLDQIQKGVREIHLTVSWKEGKRTESLDLVNDLVSLRPGSDRNGTPGAPLSATSTTAIPGVPSLPGVPAGGLIPGLNTGGNGIYGPNRGNTPQGVPLDAFGRPIRQ